MPMTAAAHGRRGAQGPQLLNFKLALFLLTFLLR